MTKIVVAGVQALVLMLVVVGHASAGTLTFDDISNASLASIPDGYGGLNWINMGYTDGSGFATSGYENGIVSGTHVAYNQNAFVGSASGSTFDFFSAYLTAAWNNDLNITVAGSLLGTTLYTQTVQVDATGPTFFNFNYLGIDQLTFESFGGTNAGLSGAGQHFVMDDMTVNVIAVPDGGSTLALLGLAAIGLGTLRRTRLTNRELPRH